MMQRVLGIYLCTIVALSLDWDVDSRRANGMTQQTLPLVGQATYSPASPLWDGRETQKGGKWNHCLTSSSLPCRGRMPRQTQLLYYLVELKSQLFSYSLLALLVK